MKTNHLIARYRNLLIQLARDARDLKEQVAAMRATLPNEPNRAKANGVRTLIHCRNRQRARLLQLLGRNNAALRLFFSTTNPENIANEKIVLH